MNRSFTITSGQAVSNEQLELKGQYVSRIWVSRDIDGNLGFQMFMDGSWRSLAKAEDDQQLIALEGLTTTEVRPVSPTHLVGGSGKIRLTTTSNQSADTEVYIEFRGY